jgi:integrase
MVILDLATALRCSELFALKWRDVLWDDLTLLVRRAIVTGIVSDVTTKYSCAGMPLDPGLADRGRQTAVVSVGSDTDRPFYKATTSLNTLALLDPLTENEGEERVRNGGADGIRTHDLLDAIEARSQLRHGPTEGVRKVYHSQ